MFNPHSFRTPLKVAISAAVVAFILFAQSGSQGPLLMQNGGTPIGAAIVLNCGTNLTCTNSGGTITATASGTSLLGNSCSAANPQRSGDATTGLDSPAADTVGICNGGSETARTSSGQMLIGTQNTAPASFPATLIVANNSSAGGTGNMAAFTAPNMAAGDGSSIQIGLGCVGFCYHEGFLSYYFVGGSAPDAIGMGMAGSSNDLMIYQSNGSTYGDKVALGSDIDVAYPPNSPPPGSLTIMENYPGLQNTKVMVLEGSAQSANTFGVYAHNATTPRLVVASGGGVGIGTNPGAILDVSGGQIRTSGTTPTIASNACGTTSQGTISGTDPDGLLTVGTTGVTTCTISLSKTYTNAFRGCVLFPANTTAAAVGTVAAYVSAITASSWTLSGTALASAAYYYHCE